MRIVCGCLNIKVEIENIFDLEILKLDLSPEEKCHSYFSKDIYKLAGKVSGISETHSRLVKSEIIGSWNIRQCFICKLHTHATNYVTGLATFSSNLKEEPTDLKAFGREHNISYSQVFQVCFPSHLDVPEDVLSSLPKCDIVDGDCIEKISKQANSFLEMAENKMRASSTLSVEKQMQSMEALKRRVKCEERLLHMFILQSKSDIVPDGASPTKVSASSLGTQSLRTEEYDPSHPLYLSELVDTNLVGHDTKDQTQLRTFSVPINSHDILQEELQILDLNSRLPQTKPISARSVDADGIFEMDGDFLNDVTSNLDPQEEEEESAKQTVPVTSSTPTPTNAEWWNDECATAVANKKRLSRQFMRNKKSIDKKNELRQARATMRRIIKDAKKAAGIYIKK